jgi:hypothetical protein
LKDKVSDSNIMRHANRSFGNNRSEHSDHVFAASLGAN